MLDPWIIEEIRRREEERRNQRQQPVVEIDIDMPKVGDEGKERGKPAETDDQPRGVVVIDFSVG
jgi:hypothetical protein